MKIFELNIGKLVMRFYLVMAIVIIAGFTGQWWMVGIAMLVFFSAALGIEFKQPFSHVKPPTKVIQLPLMLPKASIN